LKNYDKPQEPRLNPRFWGKGLRRKLIARSKEYRRAFAEAARAMLTDVTDSLAMPALRTRTQTQGAPLRLWRPRRGAATNDLECSIVQILRCETKNTKEFILLATAASKQLGEDMKLQGARILIVEDDPLVALAACDMVQSLGGVVAGAANSVASARKKIQEVEVDCVLLDLNLNGDMSFGVAAELEELAIPFIFCTAYTHMFNGFEHIPRVIKPYSEGDLVKGFSVVRERSA
jgi:CheY-like chemotaxis protein